jgi:hypothetical protein
MGLKYSIVACAAVAAASLASAQAQAAGLQNGSFEEILDDWTTNPSLFQTPGVWQHLDENGLPDKQYDPVDGFLLGVLQAGDGDVEVTITQTFTTKGGHFSGSAAFLAEDFADYNDYGFVQLIHGADVFTLFSKDVVGVGSYGYTPWTGFAKELEAGTWTFKAGIVNAEDRFNPSFLLLDALRLAEVPEPSAWALMIAGFGLTGAALRRRYCVRPVSKA